MTPADNRPLIAHVVFRFDVGGLENGVVNLLNRLPAGRYRHAVIAMTEVSGFRDRVKREDVSFHALQKPPGQGLRIAPRMVRLLRELRPDVVHTRNLGALEMMLPAAWAGVPVRIHGEHGWDSNDPDGRRLACQWTRRAYRPFVHRYVALSRHLQTYLVDRVGVAPTRIAQIYNGVDTQRFRPAGESREGLAGSPFAAADQWVVGTVGRLQPIKNQVLLARAFVRALVLAPSARDRLRLVVAGDGPQREAVQEVLRQADADSLAWLAGRREDVPEVLRALDAFVLPSRAEGVSNTILEAMASGLPIAATAVGGNAELLQEGVTGRLVPSDDVEAMAEAILHDFSDRDGARARGRRAREAAERRFSLDAMVSAYDELYEQQLGRLAARRALQRA
ncbi:TIGR03088 family PEP-CTERM/XrtA system glycosyltransferase [uncultured Piscinibacter sp.]|uniref:TIGR03088 family PEP-CTERM/XrtA system glycosyltransferase n=1 Tax=uncultured Piscinibacter sp. TaxID=1131835 RepID=UPI00262EC753|nr:TIGR03088 family PEP-CTERM/XrtA system glycosyltransferase [uncultured Piscinibacter sp.]